MTHPVDLHRKPYNDTESLYQAVLWAMEAYGKCKHPQAVLRSSFLLTPDTREFGGRPGWVGFAKLEGFGDINLDKAAERVKVEDLAQEPVFVERWESKAQTIYLVGEELRKEVSASLEGFLQQKQAEVVTAEQALNALRSGVAPEELWGDPAQAEVSLERAVTEPA